MTVTIQCQDCGALREAIYRNTLYCDSCRLLRDLEYTTLSQPPRTCTARGCTETYLPIGRKDAYCGDCSGVITPTRGLCIYCSQEDAPLHRNMKVCTYCLRDPEDRPRILRGLRSGQERRRAENANVPAPPAPKAKRRAAVEVPDL
jgi:hypothetical protein